MIETDVSDEKIWISLSTGFYHILTGPIAWTDAMTQCHKIGGKLAQIESEEENMALFEEAAKVEDTKRFWIALADFDEEDSWMWYARQANCDQR